MKDKRQLLQDLLSGRITPDQFRRQAAGPYMIRAISFHVPGLDHADPDHPVTVSMDLETRTMTRGEYLDLVAGNPGAMIGAPIIFTETKEISL